MTKRIVGYARVNTPDNRSENTYALKQQVERLKGAGVTEVLAGPGSGMAEDCPHLQLVTALVWVGEVKGIELTQCLVSYLGVVFLRETTLIRREVLKLRLHRQDSLQ